MVPRTMWTIVSWSESELGNIDRPRILVDTCPKCGRRARIIERQVVTRVKLFTIPLVALADGPRTFQCEKCRTCFEAPKEGFPVHEETAKLDLGRRVEELRARWDAVQREVDRWRQRAEMALKVGDRSLADEARRLVTRHEKDEATLRKEIERLGGAVARPPRAEPDPREIDQELEALRQKRANLKAADAPRDPVVPEAQTKPAEGSAPETPQAPPPAPPSDPVEDELSALKRKISGGNGKTEPKPAPPQAPPQQPPGGGGDEDELAALKRKLKGK